MIHNNCENAEFARFDALLTQVEQRYGEVLRRVDWVSLGGGISFTAPGYRSMPSASACAASRSATTCRSTSSPARRRCAARPRSKSACSTPASTARSWRWSMLDRGAHARPADLPRDRARSAPGWAGTTCRSAARPAWPATSSAEAASSSRCRSAIGCRSAMPPATPWSRRTGSTACSMPAIASRTGRPRACGAQFSYDDYVGSLS
jgi:hypothetical protein